MDIYSICISTYICLYIAFKYLFICFTSYSYDYCYLIKIYIDIIIYTDIIFTNVFSIYGIFKWLIKLLLLFQLFKTSR